MRRNCRWRGGDWHSYFSVYRQRVGMDIFLRIITTAIETPDFMARTVSFNQFLIHQNAFLISARYGEMGAIQFGWIVGFSSMDIIQSGNDAKAVMVTTVSVSEADRDNPNDWSGTSPRVC